MRHEDTEIYKTSLALLDEAFPIAARMPPGFGFLSDQIRRSSSSISSNFSEGCRKKSLKQRRKFFDDSAGSAAELSSQTDQALRAGAISDTKRLQVKDMCDHICAMLHKFQ